MEAYKLVFPNGKTGTMTTPVMLTPPENQTPKVVEASNCRVVVFFIGGAGDTESYYFAGAYHNVKEVFERFNDRMEESGRASFYKARYLGYSDVRGSWDISENVYEKISDKSAPVYIVGHSLGGGMGRIFPRF